MCFSVRYLAVVLFALLSLAVSLCAQTTTKQATKVPRGSVSGRVTIKDKGAPGVAIGLRKGEGAYREPYVRATTDQDGFYHIGNLAPGSYTITTSAPAYVMGDVNNVYKVVLVGEDENVEDINFALVRGGVITGRVTDADGRPAIEQQVNVFQADVFTKQFPERAIFPVGQAQTDDRGIYRVFGLTPGRYKVASGRTDEALGTSYGQERTAYKQVFHPDTSESAKAAVIEVTEGSEANNVDITLGRVMQTFSVSGLIVDSEKGMPVANQRIGVQRSVGQRVEYVNASWMSNNRGEFVIEGLIPGQYAIYVPASQGGDMRAEPLSFQVVDQDIGSLTVKLTKGVSLSGIVVLENEDKTLFTKLSELQLRAVALTKGSFGGGVGSSATSPIGPDGSFRMGGMPAGTINFMLGALMNPFPPKGFSITRIEREGEVLTSRLEVKDGEQVNGLRVVVSYGTAALRGIVKLENGSLPDGARIFLRLMKAGETVPGSRPVTVDARGHFLQEGIAAGTYELTAIIAGPTSGQRTVKREVTMQDGATTDVTITFDMTAPAKP